MPGAAAALKARQTFDAAFAIELGPTTHSVVVEIENLGDLFAAQAVVQKQHGVRAARQPMRSRPISHQSDGGGPVWRRKEAGANHVPRRIDFSLLGNRFFRRLNESGYIRPVPTNAPIILADANGRQRT